MVSVSSEPDACSVCVSITANLTVQPLLETGSITTGDLVAVIETSGHTRNIGVHVHLVIGDDESDVLELFTTA